MMKFTERPETREGAYWLRTYENYVIEISENAPLNRAKDIAMNLVVAQYGATMPTQTPSASGLCDYCCSSHGTLVIMPLGHGASVLIHDACWQEWHLERHAIAKARLLKIGVGK